MTFELHQRSESKGANEWKWSVWLAGTPAELATVERVVYHLHPTFPDSIRTVTDRKTNFRLDETGWAEFEIVAHVVKIKKGATTTLKSWLEFSGQLNPGVIQAVFISSSLADANWALELKRAFEKEKIHVVSADDASELGFPSSLESTLRKTSGAVMLMSDKSSPWARYEIDAATKAGVQVIPVQIGRTATRDSIAMKEPSDAGRVVKQIVKTLASPSKDAPQLRKK